MIYKTLKLSEADILLFEFSDNLMPVGSRRTDGTIEGTVLVEDFTPGEANNCPVHLTAVNDQLFFIACNNLTGNELHVY